MIPVYSRAVSILPSGAKRMAKWSQTILPFWLLFCCWFGYYLALVWKIDTTSLICECSCILCPNFENFCPNNGQFFSVGDATASPSRTPGPAFSRLDRLLPIGPRAKGGPALRLRTYTSNRKCSYSAGAGPTVFVKCEVRRKPSKTKMNCAVS